MEDLKTPNSNQSGGGLPTLALPIERFKKDEGTMMAMCRGRVSG